MPPWTWSGTRCRPAPPCNGRGAACSFRCPTRSPSRGRRSWCRRGPSNSSPTISRVSALRWRHSAAGCAAAAMRFSEARNRSVISTDTATTIGSVADLVMDAATAAVVAVRVKRAAGSGDMLPWRGGTAFGPGAVTVGSAAALGEGEGRAPGLGGKRAAVVGKRPLPDAGTEIGTVADVEFDPRTGQVLSLLTASGTVAGNRLIGCGSYAVIVRDAP